MFFFLSGLILLYGTFRHRFHNRALMIKWKANVPLIVSPSLYFFWTASFTLQPFIRLTRREITAKHCPFDFIDSELPWYYLVPLLLAYGSYCTTLSYYTIHFQTFSFLAYSPILITCTASQFLIVCLLLLLLSICQSFLFFHWHKSRVHTSILLCYGLLICNNICLNLSFPSVTICSPSVPFVPQSPNACLWPSIFILSGSVIPPVSKKIHHLHCLHIWLSFCS